MSAARALQTTHVDDAAADPLDDGKHRAHAVLEVSSDRSPNATRLTGAVALKWDPAKRRVPSGLYAFDFRYSDLPRNTVERLAGGDCNR